LIEYFFSQQGIAHVLGTTALSVAFLSGIVWLLKNWLLERLKGSIKSEYDRELETHKSALQLGLSKEVEAIKSGLNAKAGEITAIRDDVLKGHSARQALLYGRRMKAVDILWQEVIKLGKFKGIAATIAITNIENAAKEAAKNEQFRNIFATESESLSQELLTSNAGAAERPYISEIAWAYYSAYASVLHISFALHKALAMGLENPQQYFNYDGLKAIIKAALPHHDAYIEKNGLPACFYLLGELEQNLLRELQNMLDGKEVADRAAVERVANITVAVEKVAASRGSPS